MKMRWGGKLFFGLIGFWIGGPIGAAVGALIGHFFDRLSMQILAFSPFRPYQPGEQDAVREALLKAAFSIMGHLAKSDGRVSEEEIAQAEAMMTRMQLTADQRKEAIAQFHNGKRDDFPLNETVAEFRHAIRFRKHMLLMFLEMLLQTALADGVLHAEEEKVLVHVAEGLGVPEAQFRQILAMLIAQAQFTAGAHQQHQGNHTGSSRPYTGSSLSQAYRVLGVEESATPAEIKKAYRKLMSEHHPDKLAAKGVPEEMIRVATERAAEISTAYDAIKKARGFN
ncbi:MAG: co-chaperone DjlA [Alcanivoracaceae bacterium]|nr:co-chaperone DjlA [Alcanivoracaceae bacterium]